MNQDLKIEMLLTDFEKYHSEYQIDNFIVGKAGDIWARYKQALREISTRKNTLINMREQIEIDSFGPTLWKRMFLWVRPKRVKEIHSTKRCRMRIGMVNEIAEVERELKQFVTLALKLKEEIGDLGNGKRELLEANSWRQKALRMAGIDILVNGRIGQPTMELIIALPKKDRREVLAILSPEARPDPMKLLEL